MSKIAHSIMGRKCTRKLAAVDKARQEAVDEYIFRYRLQPADETGGAPFYEDRLLEMIRQQIANLLNMVVPAYRGEEVKLDGFKLLSDPDTIHDIFPVFSRWRQET